MEVFYLYLRGKLKSFLAKQRYYIALSCLVIGQIEPDSMGRLTYFGLPLNTILLVGALAFAIISMHKIEIQKIIYPLAVSFLALALSMLVSYPTLEGLLSALNLIVTSFIFLVLVVDKSFKEKDLFSAIKNFLIIVFLFAVITKSQTDFWDPHVLYGFNGPIVFGRLMAIGLLASIFTIDYKKPHLSDLLIVVLFIFALAWSFARGPILASLAGLLLLVPLSIFVYKNFKMGSLALIVAIVLIPSFFSLSRFSRDSSIKLYYTQAHFAANSQFDKNPRLQNIAAKIRMQLRTNFPGCFNNPPCVEIELSRDNWVDSISQRIFIWRVTAFIMTEPKVWLSGLGIGHWQKYVQFFDLEHPHNFILQAIVEMGWVLGIIFLVPFFLFFLLPKNPLFIICFTVFLYSMISGDFRDARVLLALSILSFTSFNFHINRIKGKS